MAWSGGGFAMADGSGFSHGFGFACGCMVAIVVAIILVPASCMIIGDLSTSLINNAEAPPDAKSVSRPTGDVNVRAGPGLDHEVLFGVNKDGDFLFLRDAPVKADGYVWERVRTRDGREGWGAHRYLTSKPLPRFPDDDPMPGRIYACDNPATDGGDCFAPDDPKYMTVALFQGGPGQGPKVRFPDHGDGVPVEVIESRLFIEDRWYRVRTTDHQYQGWIGSHLIEVK
jgi:SH3-like domain-containing protein